MPTADPAIFTPDEFLTVTNDDTMPLEFFWNSRRYVVQPGRTTQIPSGAVVNKGGDPRASNEPHNITSPNWPEVIFIPSRFEEIKRLRNLYGKQLEGAEDEIPEPFPKFSVFDGDGNKLHTVLEDQSGDHVEAVVHTVATDQSRDDRIDRLERELRALREEHATKLDEVPDDSLDNAQVNLARNIPQPPDFPTPHADIPGSIHTPSPAHPSMSPGGGWDAIPSG